MQALHNMSTLVYITNMGSLEVSWNPTSLYNPSIKYKMYDCKTHITRCSPHFKFAAFSLYTYRTGHFWKISGTGSRKR